VSLFIIRTLAIVAVASIACIATAAGDALTAEQLQLIQMERDNTQIWLHNDAAANALWEADEFTLTDLDGVVSDKAADLAMLRSGTSMLTRFDVDDMKATVFGDAGVVVGRGTWEGSYQGDATSEVFRFTTTYIKRDGRWQAVASQLTRIAQ